MQTRTHQRPRTTRTARGGFTLLEVAVAVIVLALGIVAVQALVGTTTRVTATANELQTSNMLANALQERCLGLDRATLLSLNNKTYSPPLDSQAVPLTELPDYRQTVSVTYVDPQAISGTSAVPTDLLRISVTVAHKGRDVLTSRRIIATTRQE